MLTVHFGSDPVNTENFTLLARVVFWKLWLVESIKFFLRVGKAPRPLYALESG